MVRLCRLHTDRFSAIEAQTFLDAVFLLISSQFAILTQLVSKGVRFGLVRATPLNIPKQVLCRLYKKFRVR